MIRIEHQVLPWENVRVRVRGSLNITYNSECTPNPTTASYGPNGTPSLTFGVQALPSDSSLAPFLTPSGSTGWSADPNGDGWVDYMRNQHDDRYQFIWAGRGQGAEECEAGGGGSGNWVPALMLSSTQTVTVEPLVFRITPSVVEFQPGQSVLFTLAVANVSAANIRWKFFYSPVGQAGALLLPQCDGQLQCDAAPAASGQMDVSADVSGMVGQTLQTRSEHVTHLGQCPTPDDTLLKVKAIRDSLGKLLKASKPDTMPDTLRREVAAHVLKNRVTGAIIFKRSAIDPTATNCRTDNVFPLDTDAFILLAMVHTHPYNLLDVIAFCGNQRDGRTYLPGGSNDDWNSLRTIDSTLRAVQPNDRVKEYIVDKNSVIRLRLTDNATRVFLHSRSGCKWWS